MPYTTPTGPYQSYAQLGDLVYPYNPLEIQIYQTRDVVYQEALVDGFYTDFQANVTDMKIPQTWPEMDYNFYQALLAMYTASSAQYTFVDPWGVSRTVIIMDLMPKSLVAGGAPFIENVKLTLGVVSVP